MPALTEPAQLQVVKVEEYFNIAVAKPKGSYTNSTVIPVGDGLGVRTARGNQFGSGGVVGPTNGFDTSGAPGHGIVQRPPMLVEQNGSDQDARLLSRPTPDYTEEARRLNISGEVQLEVKMRADGTVQVLRVVPPHLGYGLDEAATAAVNKARCQPAMKDGHRVDVITTVTVIFRLT